MSSHTRKTDYNARKYEKTMLINNAPKISMSVLMPKEEVLLFHK